MATTEQFSLRWNNFHSNLTTGFHELLEASDLVDVTLAVEGRFLLAHKIVLSICSPYFKQMFKMNPCKHPIVILKDVTHENMKDILEFMYVGEVNVLRENLPSFLRTAELLQVKGLTGDDSQSETSSKKGEKQDSLCGEQEEDQELTQMFENENMRLPQYSPDLITPSQKTQPNKRNAKQTVNSNSSKRTKNDNNNVNKPNKCIIEEELLPDRPNIKSESVYDFDDQKEAIKSFDSNNVNYSMDTNLQDHVGNFSQEWEVAHIQTRTPYKAGSSVQINASIGLRIGLRGVNVTLKSDVDENGPLKYEKINYNERFYWTWDQGQAGFGPYAGTLQKEFRAAQYRGTPMPILQVVEYFIIDGGGFRFGRFYRTAGWFAHMCMWAAFPCWLLANIFFRSVIRYGGYLLGLAGILQLTANALWVIIRNPNSLAIPFEDGVLTTRLGLSFWLTFTSGILCITLFAIVTITDIFFSNKLHYFFGVDPLSVVDIKYNINDEQCRDVNYTRDSSRDDERALIRADRRTSLQRVKRHTNTIIQSHYSAIAGPSR